jgi:hypothetical protein
MVDRAGDPQPELTQEKPLVKELRGDSSGDRK